jgi:hypothetical protein
MSVVYLNIEVLKDEIDLLDDGFSAGFNTESIQHVNDVISSGSCLVNSFDPKHSFDVTSTRFQNKLSILVTFSLNSFISVNFLLLSFIRNLFAESFYSHFMQHKLLDLFDVLIVKVGWFEQSQTDHNGIGCFKGFYYLQVIREIVFNLRDDLA